jgi:hypothetical protein
MKKKWMVDVLEGECRKHMKNMIPGDDEKSVAVREMLTPDVSPCLLSLFLLASNTLFSLDSTHGAAAASNSPTPSQRPSCAQTPR